MLPGGIPDGSVGLGNRGQSGGGVRLLPAVCGVLPHRAGLPAQRAVPRKGA